MRIPSVLGHLDTDLSNVVPPPRRDIHNLVEGTRMYPVFFQASWDNSDSLGSPVAAHDMYEINQYYNHIYVP